MRIAAIVGILIGLIGLGIDFWQIIPGMLVVSDTNPVARSWFDSQVSFWTYFAHLTNLGLVLVYVANASGWRWLGWFAKPRTMGLMGGYILLVMLYYHFMLAPLYTFEGPLLWATVTLHYIAPIYYLAWWAIFAPHPRLRYAEIGWMLVAGLLYVAWVLLRGLVVHEYPYDILDAGKFGYGQVVIGVGFLLVAVVIFCAAMISADKLIGRARKAG
jgi:hypothetical protein